LTDAIRSSASSRPITPCEVQNRGRLAIIREEILITGDFSSMVRQRRRERGLTQEYVAAWLQIEEGRPITQSYLAEIERGHHPHPRPHLIEEFARVLSIDRSSCIWRRARYRPRLRIGWHGSRLRNGRR
jgi:ribosome-binding protein aMBF1 (putative translation factor)